MPQRYELYNPYTDKVSKVSSLYGRRAKEIYRGYIDILDWEPATFLPDGMLFEAGQLRYAPETHSADLWRAHPAHLSTAVGLRGMVANHTLTNHALIPGFAGLNLIHHFTPVLREFLQQHHGLSRQFKVKFLASRLTSGSEFGQIIEEEREAYVSSSILQILNPGQIKQSLDTASPPPFQT